MVPETVASSLQLLVDPHLHLLSVGGTFRPRDCLAANARINVHCPARSQADQRQVASGSIATAPEVVWGHLFDETETRISGSCGQCLREDQLEYYDLYQVIGICS